MNVLKPQHPYAVEGMTEYRVVRWIDRSTDPYWCLILVTDKLDKALDAYGDGRGMRIERCTWKPAPEVRWDRVAPPTGAMRSHSVSDVPRRWGRRLPLYHSLVPRTALPWVKRRAEHALEAKRALWEEAYDRGLADGGESVLLPVEGRAS